MLKVYKKNHFNFLFVFRLLFSDYLLYNEIEL